MSVLDEDALSLLNQGDRAWSAGRIDEAINRYQTLTERFPDRPDGYNKLGVVYAEIRDLGRATEYFLRALEHDQEHVASLSNLGNIYLEQGEVTTAIWYYSRALEADPEYPPAHHNLAVAYRRQGNVRDSVRHLKQAERYERSRRPLAPARRAPASPLRLSHVFSGARWWWLLLVLAALVVLPRVIR